MLRDAEKSLKSDKKLINNNMFSIHEKLTDNLKTKSSEIYDRIIICKLLWKLTSLGW